MYYLCFHNQHLYRYESKENTENNEDRESGNQARAEKAQQVGRVDQESPKGYYRNNGYEGRIEMRYYLDTNILIFMMQGQLSELTNNTKSLLSDYENLFYTSSVCVHEFIHLCQIGKLKSSKRSPIDGSKIIPWLHEMGIEINPVTKQHLEAMATLPLRKDHHDPFDRLIIAQAVTDGIGIITSDRQFENYRRYGLQLTFNER